jgi:uncharacterized protein with HEPN domain
VTETPENAILVALVTASESVAIGLREAIQLMGPVPQTADAFLALGLVERTAATALLKRVEQQQDIVARLYRTALIADGVDVSGMTARDIANRMEKLGALADVRVWSDLVRLRNRLAHEYPVAITEQFDRVVSAAAAISALDTIRGDLIAFLQRQSLLAKA